MSDRSAPDRGAEGGAGRAEPVVVVRDLVKRYGDRTVLDGISLSVARGELVALLGPNGAGKTTTVEVIEGYRQAEGGAVRVLDKDPAHGGRELRARVGLMLQGGGIDPRAQPRETLVQYGRFHVDARNPDELLDLVGLRAVARTRYRRLSGGERQRLGLALALVGRPEVLVLDEPTAGMDPEGR
ncbi:MAG: ABC transporter ATP-binding protein, partial [Chloroflexota bacterium]